MRFIIRVVVNAFAIWVVTLIPALNVDVIAFAPGETLQLVLTLLVVAAIFAVADADVAGSPSDAGGVATASLLLLGVPAARAESLTGRRPAPAPAPASASG